MLSPRRWQFTGCLVFGALLPTTAIAQETPSDTLLTVEHFLDLERVGGP